MKTKTRNVGSCLCLCLFLMSCVSPKSDVNDLVLVDVTRSLSEKDIYIEDVAQIKYVRIASDSDFIYKGGPMVISEDEIVIYDRADGAILFFTIDGKPKSKFNKRGNGPMEYSSPIGMIHDTESDELFVADMKRIQVYSTDGEYKRTLSFAEGSSPSQITNCGSSLLFFDRNNAYPSSFVRISKSTGEVEESITMPSATPVTLFLMEQSEKGVSVIAGPSSNIVKYKSGFLLTDHALDTVYYYQPGRPLNPALVRDPAIQSMDPIIYLNSFVEAGGYLFYQSVEVKGGGTRLPVRYMMIDRESGETYLSKIAMKEYKGKYIELTPLTTLRGSTAQIGFIELSLPELKEADSEGRLSGQLKQLVKEMDDEENNLLLLLNLK